VIDNAQEDIISVKRKIALILSLIVLIVACSQKSREELFAEGVRLMDKENNPNGAIVLFKNAIEKDPNYVEARFQLAKAYIAVGKFDSAEKELLNVLGQNPAARGVRLELARVYLELGKPDDALKGIDGLLGDGSNDRDALEIAGTAHALKGDYPKAIDFLKKAVASNGARSTASVSLAKVYLKMNNLSEAKLQIADVLKKDPLHRDGLYVLADIQMKEKKPADALKTYEQIANAYPADMKAYFGQGLLLIDTQKYAEARSLADSLIDKFSKRPDGYRLKGIVLFSEKKYDEATIALQRSLSLQPDVVTHYVLGLCHYYRNEPEQALTQLQSALSLKADFVQARLLSAIIDLQKNRTDDAIREMRRVLEQDQTNSIAHNILGSAYLAKGMYDAGIEELNRAIEQDPQLVDAHIKKGLVDLNAGRFTQAETELKTAVQVAPELLYSRAMLASSYMKQEEYDKAIDILKKGIKGDQTDAFIYNLIAEALSRQNKIADAVAYLQKAKEANPAFDVPYFRLSSIYFLKGEHDKGIQEIKALLAKSPDHVKAMLTVAAMLESKGKKGEALPYYLRAKATNKTEGYIALANYYLREKDTQKALQTLDENISKTPSDLLPYEMKGMVLLEQKRFDEAIRTFETLATVNMNRGMAYLVNAYIAMKKPEAAADRLRREIAKNPQDLGLMAELSRVYLIMGKKQDAVDNAEQMIRKNPESPIGHLTLAMIYQESKEIDKAMDVIKKASSLKDADLMMAMANLYFIKKDHAAALNQYRRIEELKAGYVPAIFQQGVVLQAMGKKKEAIADYRRVLRLSQNYVPALNNLAYLYAEDNRDLTMALQLAARAYAQAPNDGSVQDTLGFVLIKNKKYDQGIVALQKAAQLLPDNPTIHYHLALAYKEQGSKGPAVANLEKALAMGAFPEANDARLLLSQLKK